MQFNPAAFDATVALVVISGLMSVLERTFMSKLVTMDFLHHGGMWGDLLILSVVNGYIAPYLTRDATIIYCLSAVAVILTLVAHWAWVNGMREHHITGHMFPAHVHGMWYKDLSLSGWMHVVTMAFLLGMLLAYIVSPMPRDVVFLTSFLVNIHVVLGTVQPGWYCTGSIFTKGNLVPPAAAIVLIWAIAAVKLH